MAGRQHGYVTSQGMILADRFAAAGFQVTSASSSTNRYLRLLDIIVTLIRNWRAVDVQCLEVYGGPSFVVEDIASLLGRLLGQRIIMVLHGGALPDFMARYPRWTRRVLNRADVIVTPTEYLARAVASYGFQAQVIPNVIDPVEYPYRRRKHLSPRLLWMRAFHQLYNPQQAVRVLARLIQDVPAATLVMAGQDKGTQEEMVQLAKSLGVDGAVRFPGFLDPQAKAREGDAADIFINTSSIDNMPVSIIEACAMGLPVVTTNVGGIPDLLEDGESGMLVPPDDDELMVRAIHSLLEDPAMAERLSSNGRLLAERSSWEEVRPQWEQLFTAVMTCGSYKKVEIFGCVAFAASSVVTLLIP